MIQSKECAEEIENRFCESTLSKRGLYHGVELFVNSGHLQENRFFDRN